MNRQNYRWIWLIFFGSICTYIGYLISGMFDFNTPFKPEGVIERINYRLQHPFGFWWNKYSIWCIAIVLLIFILSYLLYYDPRKEKMKIGKEYGSASWGNIKLINSNMEDKSNEFNNKIFSNNLRVATDTKKINPKYMINNNVMVIGGSGAGKSRFLAKPNVLQMPDNMSFICTDPDGGLLRDTGHLMRSKGYNVRVLNLMEFSKSDHFNPFRYLKTDKDIEIFTQNLIDNTTPPEATKSDPFWENAEKLLLKSIFYYICYEEPEYKRNFRTVMEFLGQSDVPEKGKVSGYEKLILDLEEKEKERGKNGTHPAVQFYHDCMSGADDTKRSIVISAKARLNALYNSELLDLLSHDDLLLEELGTGVNKDKKTKTILYCIIPDSMDTTYNFIVGIMYTLLIQELYYQADHIYGGQLPINITILMDEFANVALPRNIEKIFATCRKRGIGIWAILQNVSQLKVLFKDSWESIVGNCDTFVYLGGNENASHKYISEKLGTATIYKRHDSVNTGKNGGGSKSMDVLGRKLMTEDEVEHMDNDKCIVFIKGQKPIYDLKYEIEKHPYYNELNKGDENKYIFIERCRGLEILSEEYVKSLKEDVKIVDIDADVLMYQYALGLTEDAINNTTQTEKEENKSETPVKKETTENSIRLKNRVLSDIVKCESDCAEIFEILEELSGYIDIEKHKSKYHSLRKQLTDLRNKVDETNAESIFKEVESVAKEIQALNLIVFDYHQEYIKE